MENLLNQKKLNWNWEQSFMRDQSQTNGPCGTFEWTIIRLAKSENPNTFSEVRISPETQRRIRRVGSTMLQEQLAAPKTSDWIIFETIYQCAVWKIIFKKLSSMQLSFCRWCISFAQLDGRKAWGRNHIRSERSNV